MGFPYIKSEDLDAHFDSDNMLLFITYRGVLSDKQTLRVYEWFHELLTATMKEGLYPSDLRGAVFDFREVTDFRQYNLLTVMRESQKMNKTANFSHVPVAMVVNSLLQEELVRVALKVSPQDYRKRIVRTPQEALNFIDNWHREHA
ncbi:MAG: hypothetical protein D6712_13670 [Chloroflexi bacterium]|nr:MAG: hypothetical protein D6712_13670 [Chloroflexota bacterium]